MWNKEKLFAQRIKIEQFQDLEHDDYNCGFFT